MKYFVFCHTDIMLQIGADGSYSIPDTPQPPTPVQPWTHVMDVECGHGLPTVRTYRIDAPIDSTATPQYVMCPLRASYYRLTESDYLAAGKCQELLYWDANTRYCGVCGAPMRMHTIISKRCTQCGKEVWPQLSTAIIVLVSRGKEMLLVHAKNFRSDFYGLVAGFVETGETLEQAVQREVSEETGLSICNIRYFASQPWPYPCGLMVGFTADYADGELHLQREELSAGGWFTADALPRLPEPLSIARRLIDHHLSVHRN